MAPSGVRVKRNTSDDSVLVNWHNLTLTEARGWIVNYTIHYWDIGSQDRKSARNFSTDREKTSHTFSGQDFDSLRTYNIVVTASTIAGEGVDSLVVVLVGKSLPPTRSNAGTLYYNREKIEEVNFNLHDFLVHI